MKYFTTVELTLVFFKKRPRIVNRSLYRYWESPVHFHNCNPASFAFRDLLQNHYMTLRNRFIVEDILEYNPKFLLTSEKLDEKAVFQHSKNHSVEFFKNEDWKKRVHDHYQNQLAFRLKKVFGDAPSAEKTSKAKQWAAVMRSGLTPLL